MKKLLSMLILINFSLLASHYPSIKTDYRHTVSRIETHEKVTYIRFYSEDRSKSATLWKTDRTYSGSLLEHGHYTEQEALDQKRLEMRFQGLAGLFKDKHHKKTTLNQ